MTDEQAIQKANTINDLHAHCDGAKAVRGTTATGAIRVQCGCGVELCIPDDAPAAKDEAKTPEPMIKGRRVFVNDKDGE